MHLIVTFVATAILFIGIAIGQSGKIFSGNNLLDKSDVLSEDSVREESNDFSEEVLSPTPSNTGENISQPEDTSSLEVTNGDYDFLSNYIYPESEVTDLTHSSLHLKSSSDPDIVTDWYEKKIKSSGFDMQTFVKTSANDEVLNKLVGTNSQFKVSIEINKSPGDETLLIEVSVEKN